MATDELFLGEESVGNRSGNHRNPAGHIFAALNDAQTTRPHTPHCAAPVITRSNYDNTAVGCVLFARYPRHVAWL